MQTSNNNKLNIVQMNLIKSFQFLRNEKQLNEIDSLINFYLEKKLDDAITIAESKNNYNAAIYEEWLNAQKNNKI